MTKIPGIPLYRIMTDDEILTLARKRVEKRSKHGRSKAIFSLIISIFCVFIVYSTIKRATGLMHYQLMALPNEALAATHSLRWLGFTCGALGGFFFASSFVWFFAFFTLYIGLSREAKLEYLVVKLDNQRREREASKNGNNSVPESCKSESSSNV